MAEDVCRRILKDGRPNRKEAAYALHDAVKRLRDSGRGFMYWEPFIHLCHEFLSFHLTPS